MFTINIGDSLTLTDFSFISKVCFLILVSFLLRNPLPVSTVFKVGVTVECNYILIHLYHSKTNKIVCEHFVNETRSVLRFVKRLQLNK